MTHPFQELWILPLLLYAETHYRFPYCFSFLSKSEPELIADAPHRLEPNRSLPVLILVKDAHLYPCTLRQVSIEVRQEQRIIQRGEHLDQPIELDQKFFWHIIHLDLSSRRGWVELDVRMTLERNGKSKSYHNDNYRTSTHHPLRVFLATDPLPRFPDLHLGDPHTHSNFTDDQVEFGVPLAPACELARALGLSYFCVTDHSYDLDDHVHSYLANDPDLAKWQTFQSEVDRLGSELRDFAVVRGEEVSCRNSIGRNVHLLLFGQREFIHGSGDGAERWLRTRSEYSVPEVLRLKSGASAAYAAHAKEPVPFLQRLLLGRGIWTDQDLGVDGMTGLQMLNGMLDEGFHEGYRSWIKQLLNGKRLLVIAGNDAHGNFNRVRQIGIPFAAIREDIHQIFGRMRTGVFVNETVSEETVTKALQSGNSIATDGPVVRAFIGGSSGHRSGFGESANSSGIDLELEVHSSSEFGEITSIHIMIGKTGDTSERTAFRFEGKQGFISQKQVSLKEATASYVRIEAWTSEDNPFDRRPHFCFTNPIWVS
ncbi:MAG: CehA/McbA family metallohydrolase [Ignavibacteria bacterium]|nr:CehA/McbA family metallohydrolase [Ignavibacteria bacterium]